MTQVSYNRLIDSLTSSIGLKLLSTFVTSITLSTMWVSTRWSCTMWILDNNLCIHCTIIGTMRNVMITMHNAVSVDWSEIHSISGNK